MDQSSNSEPSLDKIIDEMNADYTGELPVGALREAQRRSSEITPRLIELIRKAAQGARDGNCPKGSGHFFAIFLLTEFRAKEALPAIVEAVTLPGEAPFDLFGDAITEFLDKSLATMACDQPMVLDSLIRNRQVNQYVRWAAIRAYELLVRDKAVTSEHAVQRLREHLWDANIEMDDEIAGPLAFALENLGPKESSNEIREALRRGLIDDPMSLRMEDGEKACTETEGQRQQALDRLGPSGIQDTVQELRKWAAYRPKTPDPKAGTLARFETSRQTRAATESPKGIQLDFSPKLSLDKPLHHGAARNRIGRNAPCPCGSGKKFKKCCGAPK